MDVAFLDIAMQEMNGLDLAMALKRSNSQINIIFVSAFGEYMHNALKMHVSGYILKPARPAQISDELENLRFPPASASRRAPETASGTRLELAKGLYVKCFGSFGFFDQGVPVKFPRTKTMEIFAYLIDRRGANASIGEILSNLWDDDDVTESRKSQLRTRIAELRATLDAHGAGEWIVKNRGFIAVRPDLIRCDYYSFLDGDQTAQNRYTGEYMTQYSWAELTNGWLYEKIANAYAKIG
jgi:two-component SAPR family response regulator